LEQRNELDIVEALVDYLSYEHSKHFPRNPSEFWVTDLTRCSRKRELELSYPEFTWFNVFNTRLIIAELIHKGLEYLAECKLLVGLPHNVHTELMFEKTLDLDDENVVVTGRPDLTFEHEDEIKAVVDIKFVVGLRGVPHEHHKLQIALYKWISGAENGYLFYVSPEGFSQHRVDSTIDDNGVKKLIAEKKAPRYSWECGYCVYARFCSSAIRRRGGKP